MRVDWSSNEKSLICNDCPYSDKSDQCLTAGIGDNRATLTFILRRPQKKSCRSGQPLNDRDGRLFKHLFKQARNGTGRNPPYQILYAVGKGGTGRPKKAALNVCHEYDVQKLISYREAYEERYPDDDKTHVLVTMGAQVSRAFWPEMDNLNDRRGVAHRLKVGGYEFAVVPTFGLANVSVQPGITPKIVKDFAYAMGLCRRSYVQKKTPIEEVTKEYVIPESKEELFEVTEEILNYYDKEKVESAKDWPIAIDTETNSLDPWRRDSRVLIASIAWDDRKSTAIALDHEESPYSSENARECLSRILASEKPKIFHNMKFDYEYLKHCEGFEVNNLWWDTLLGEHYLNEDIKGHYGLDSLAKEYASEYTGYKTKIQESLVEKVKNDLLEDIDQQEPDFRQSSLLSPFYPDIKYEPACEREDVKHLLDEEKLYELFSLEKEYIEAHLSDDGDAAKSLKTKARSKVRRRCKKWGIEYPDNAKDRNYSEEIEGKGYENVPYDVLMVYAATDTDVTRIACKKQLRRAHKSKCTKQINQVMSHLVVPGSVELSKLQHEGTYLDQERLYKMDDEVKKESKKRINALQNIVCDDEFNPNSGKQLGKVVTQKLPFEQEDIVLTSDKNVSITGDWIDTMLDKYEGDNRGEFLKHLKVLRECTKANGFIESFKKLSEHDNCLHPTFWLNGTKTGRLSCRDPNLQQIPTWMAKLSELGVPGWNIKSLFVPKEDRVIGGKTFDNLGYWQMDISQAEIRVLGAYSKDPQLVKAMREGLDVHSFITSKVFKMEYEEVYNNKDTDPDIKLKRTACKRVVFGTIYGAGVKKIAEQIYGQLSSDPQEKDAQINFASSVRNTLFSKFPRIRTYVEKTKLEVHNNGYVETYFGRRRRFNIKNVSGYLRYKAEREGVNFKIQSTSSDIVLSQLIEVGQNIDAIDANMLITVHDSMIGEVNVEAIPKMEKFFDYYVVDRVKKKFPWLPVPFAYDLEIGPTYGEPMDYDFLMTPIDEMDENQKGAYESLNDRKREFYHKVREAA